MSLLYVSPMSVHVHVNSMQISRARKIHITTDGPASLLFIPSLRKPDRTFDISLRWSDDRSAFEIIHDATSCSLESNADVLRNGDIIGCISSIFALRSAKINAACCRSGCAFRIKRIAFRILALSSGTVFPFTIFRRISARRRQHQHNIKEMTNDMPTGFARVCESPACEGSGVQDGSQIGQGQPPKLAILRYALNSMAISGSVFPLPVPSRICSQARRGGDSFCACRMLGVHIARTC